jgi:hypothetical protein
LRICSSAEPTGRSLAIALLLAWGSAASAGEATAPAPRRPLLLDGTFPIEVSLSEPSALLHWLDSLAGLSGRGFTAGKTVPAHRVTFHELLGVPTPVDVRMLDAFRQARVRFAEDRAGHDRDVLTLAFFDAETIDDALTAATKLLSIEEREPLASAIRHFAARHARVWDGGRIPRAFLGRDGGPERRSALARFLVDVARFYGVEPGAPPPPVLVPLPVADGFGTHAQAIGRYLLVEVLPGDGQKLRPAAWSGARPWYHEPQVDDFAKRIFPIVRDALAARSTLDTGLAVRLASAFDATPRATKP